MKKAIFVLMVTVLVSLTLVSVVSAQNQELELELTRDFGYGGQNGEIQGTFSIRAKGVVDFEKVQFFMDETFFGEDTEAPFAIQFITNDYPEGHHVFTAIGYTRDGRKINSQPIDASFISKAESMTGAIKMVGPILVLLFGGVLISSLKAGRNARKGIVLPAGAPRDYSFGGGICPKCGRPFGFQLFGVKIIGGRITPCPHCGEWSFIKRATLEDLHEAERAELKAKIENQAVGSSEQIRKNDLDDSKYRDFS